MCLSIICDTVPSCLPRLIWPPIVLAEAALAKYNHCLVCVRTRVCMRVCVCVAVCDTHCQPLGFIRVQDGHFGKKKTEPLFPVLQRTVWIFFLIPGGRKFDHCI